MPHNFVDPRRVRKLNDQQLAETATGCIVYWMSRDQRAEDNWALLYAQQLALNRQLELRVVFNLVPSFLGATARQFGFMLKGLAETEAILRKHNIALEVVFGDPAEEIPKFAHKHKAAAVITDFSPLRIGRQWRKHVAEKLTVPLFEVDAHNVVPCWLASPKQEFGAYTLRPKLHKLLPEFLTDFPKLHNHTPNNKLPAESNWTHIRGQLTLDESVPEVDWITPGSKAAHHALNQFLEHTLSRYEDERSDPNTNAESNLSPYLHFGQLAPQRAAWEAQLHHPAHSKGFIEELVVRRELADNFCFYNPHYDSPGGFPEWAKKTIAEHVGDAREYLYTRHQLETAATHDPLWNAAQLEMVQRGKMHNYLRMYWAKKILEWTPDAATAMRDAIYLNDKYELDGRDPNGYTGIAWSIGGVHDRAWFERAIFGKIRYMNFNGAKSKFDIKAYIARYGNGEVV
jgi:deoxyribodipyrimidine photo-lyase